MTDLTGMPTPGPWVEKHVSGWRSASVHGADGTCIATALSVEDAAFIVQACNAYGSTDALRSALAELLAATDPARGRGSDRELDARAKAVAALSFSTDTFDLEAFIADELEPGELRPCPFCGGEAEVYEFDDVGEDDENFGGSAIVCTNCQCTTAVHFDRKEHLYSSWNERAAPDAARTALAGVTPTRSATNWDNAKSRIVCALHEFSPDGPIEEGTDLSVIADSILQSLTADGSIIIERCIAPSAGVTAPSEVDAK